MKINHLLNLFKAPSFLIPVLLLVAESMARPAVITWTNTLGGNWNVAANWNPNQVPGTNDTANITNGGSYAVTLNLNTNVSSLVIGGAASGVQVLQGNGFSLAATNASINNGGVLALTNATFSGALNVASSGVLTVNNVTLNAQVTVAGGGQFLLVGSSSSLGQVGQSANTNDWLWVQNGGQLNAASSAALFLYSAMTNAGLLNFTYEGVYVYNNGTANYNGGLVNQSGGVLNLINTAVIRSTYGSEYLLNQGTINVTNGSTYINVPNLNNQGTVATLPGTGTLSLGTFNGLGSLTGTYAAAAGTVIQFEASASPGTSAGAGLTLDGSGQFQFYSGLLTLPSNVIPGLTLAGGNLLLGPAFQGGAITNLVMDGINLTNTLPVTGTLVMTNGTLTGPLTISSGAGLTFDAAVVNTFGPLTVPNGAVLSVNATTLNAQVTVASGGQLLLVGSGSGIGQSGQSANANDWLWVQNGGQLNAASSAALNLYSAMTNAGLLNFTNVGIRIYNNGTASENGGVVNQGGGVLNLISTAGINGSAGSEYLLNQGTINIASGSSTISVPNLNNPGTVATLPGTGTLTIGTFNGLGSLTGTYNAAAGTIIQFVASASPGTSAGAGLTLAGSGQFQFYSGLLTLPNNVVPGLTVTGGNLSLGAGFQGGSITNLVLIGVNLTNNLPITGTLILTNSTLTGPVTISSGAVLTFDAAVVNTFGPLTVPNGAVLSVNSTTLNAQVTVASGGQLLLVGSGSGIGQSGQSANASDWLWVQNGGQLNAASSAALNLYSAMTNAGLLNFTNVGIRIYNNGTANENGGVVNQGGGVLNLISTAGINGSAGSEYLLNQGTINIASGSSTISVPNLNNQGTVATLPGTGTLTIGTFNGLGSLTGTYNAAAGTIIQFVASASPGTSAGVGLTLGGSGQYQLYGGLLNLPSNMIPGLALTAGNVLLGAGFQGGAITNLVLGGASLTNTLPVTGSLTMTNGSLYGSVTISSGAVLIFNGVTVNTLGPITVPNGAVLSVSGTILNAQVTVASGGQMLLAGSSSYVGQSGLAANTNDWLWVQNGGELNAASSALLFLYSAMTNAGLLNFTNGGIYIYNNGTTGENGGLVNQAGGVLNLISSAMVNGNSSSDYLLNQGTINVTNNNSIITVNDFTNSGTLNAQVWSVQLEGSHVSLQPSGTLEVTLASPTQYGGFSFTGNAASAAVSGAFVASLANGYLPAAGTAFNTLSCGALSGAFTSFSLTNLQPRAVWQPVYANTGLTLDVQTPMNLLPSGSSVVIGVNGAPGHNAILLTSTNLVGPFSQWTPVVTNTFGATTFVGVTNSFNPTVTHQSYFVFKLP